MYVSPISHCISHARYPGTRTTPSKWKVRKLIPIRSWHSVGGFRLRVHHRPHARKHAVHHGDSLGRLRNPRIDVLGRRLRWRRARLRLPHPQRAKLWVAGHQLAQCRRTGARQADHEHRTPDDFVVYLGMLRVGVDDPQSLDEGIADGRVLDDRAHLVEIGFAVQRVNCALQTLAIVGRPEVLEPGRGACARLRVRPP